MLGAHIGRVLRRLRNDRGLSLRQVAGFSEGRFTPTTIAGYERGERSISVERIVALARLYGTPAERLLGEAVRASTGTPSWFLVRARLAASRSQAAATVRTYVASIEGLRAGPTGDEIAVRAGDLEVIALASGGDPGTFLARLRDEGIVRATPSH